MHLPRDLRDDTRGFTLIEVLVASFVLIVGVLATLTLFESANRATVTTRAREGATNLARELVEGARSIAYEELNSGAIAPELQKLPGLEDSAVGGVYTIERRGTLYTITPTVCTMDDAKDGGGARPSGLTFCADSVAPGTTDKNPEDYRRVALTVTWQRNGKTRTVSQSGIVNNPGSATGPAVRTLFVDSTPAPYEITSTSGTPLLMKLTTSSKPTVVTWSLDGSVQPTAPTAVDATLLLWQFNWPIAGIDDGPYLVSAEAFNQYGVSGPGRTETVTLNRFLPRKPNQLAGGRTIFNTVELEWAANTERDIVGYEVERTNDGATICALATQKLDTFCTDTAPLSADPLFYRVRAYDKTPGTGTPRAGPWSDTLTVVTSNRAPNAPTITQATKAGAVVTLKWKRPSPEDPDPAPDGVAFYRVYRDGVLQANRYDRWFDGATVVTWQDSRTGGLAHVYWVTAVDTHFAESAFAGPAVPL
jgi:type II secretory pathway pseudopilin PulG